MPRGRLAVVPTSSSTFVVGRLTAASARRSRCRRRGSRRFRVGTPTATPADTATAAPPPRRCSTLAALTSRTLSAASHELLSSKHESSSLADAARTAATGVIQQRDPAAVLLHSGAGGPQRLRLLSPWRTFPTSERFGDASIAVLAGAGRLVRDDCDHMVIVDCVASPVLSDRRRATSIGGPLSARAERAGQVSRAIARAIAKERNRAVGTATVAAGEHRWPHVPAAALLFCQSSRTALHDNLWFLALRL